MRGAVAAIELQQRGGRVVGEPRQAGVEQPAARGRVTDAPALELQHAEFLRPVENPQVAVEFKAVDDGGRIREQDVLRPQIAVALDYTAGAGPRVERWPERAERRELQPGEPGGASRVEGLEHAHIGDGLCREPRAELACTRNRRFGRGVENGERVGHALEHRPVRFAAFECGVEEPPPVEAPHLDQPVHDLAGAAGRHAPVLAARERQGAQIHVGREAAIEPHVVLGIRASRLDRAVVHRVAAHGLSELERPIADEKDPCEVSLDRLVARAAKCPELRDLRGEDCRTVGRRIGRGRLG